MASLQTLQASIDKCRTEPNLIVNYIDEWERFAHITDDETKKKLDVKVTDDKNLYHIAVEMRNIKAVKTLNALITVEQREFSLKQMRHRGNWDHFRGGIQGISARCKTPVHMAIGQWAEKNGNDQMYDALLEGLPPRVIITVLETDDEKCRDAFDIARSCREKNKKREIMNRVSSDIGLAKKSIDGK